MKKFIFLSAVFCICTIFLLIGCGTSHNNDTLSEYETVEGTITELSSDSFTLKTAKDRYYFITLSEEAANQEILNGLSADSVVRVTYSGSLEDGDAVASSITLTP